MFESLVDPSRAWPDFDPPLGVWCRRSFDTTGNTPSKTSGGDDLPLARRAAGGGRSQGTQHAAISPSVSPQQLSEQGGRWSVTPFVEVVASGEGERQVVLLASGLDGTGLVEVHAGTSDRDLYTPSNAT